MLQRENPFQTRRVPATPPNDTPLRSSSESVPSPAVMPRANAANVTWTVVGDDLSSPATSRKTSGSGIIAVFSARSLHSVFGAIEHACRNEHWSDGRIANNRGVRDDRRKKEKRDGDSDWDDGSPYLSRYVDRDEPEDTANARALAAVQNIVRASDEASQIGKTTPRPTRRASRFAGGRDRQTARDTRRRSRVHRIRRAREDRGVARRRAVRRRRYPPRKARRRDSLWRSQLAPVLHRAAAHAAGRAPDVRTRAGRTRQRARSSPSV